jgi:hypothetical protein
MFYGRFTDSLGAPFANASMGAGDGQNDSPSLLEGSGFSDPNGDYAVAVLAETNAWNVWPSLDTVALANYILSQGQSVALASGQAYRQDFTALPATTRISGQVLDRAGNPVGGVLLGGGAFIGGVNYNFNMVQTDDSGHYSLAAAPGQWHVKFTAYGSGPENLASHGLVDLFGPYTVNIPPANPTLNITVYPAGASTLSAPERLSESQVRLYVNGSVFTTYTLQVSTNLFPTNWASVFSFQLLGNPFQLIDSHATNQQRFYRLLKN